MQPIHNYTAYIPLYSLYATIQPIHYYTMRGHHRQNAVLNSVLVNLILLFKTITTEFRATQQNLKQHNRIWGNTTEFGAKEQNLRQQNLRQQNLGQDNGI